MPFKVLPEISEKQYEIMDMVWKFRFMNRYQIQKFFNYKSPRRLNEWLRDLVEKGYLGRIYSHKLLENTKPSIYYLMNNGIILHRWRQFDFDEVEGKDMKKFYEDKHASEVFIKHNIAVCYLYHQIIELKNKDWDYELYTKNEIWTADRSQYQSEEEYGQHPYYPDIHVIKGNKHDDREAIFNIELYDPQIPWYAIEGKVRKYFEMYTSNEVTVFQNDKTMPMTIMLIFPNTKKVKRTKKFIKDMFWEHSADDLMFKLSTYDKVITQGIGNKNIWKTVDNTYQDEDDDE